jgi:hypothetical protein
MTAVDDFGTRLVAKVAEQLRAQRVGYLLGAGSSHLNGEGYPLTFDLWDLIKGRIADSRKRDEIQAKLDSGASGIEHALDLLDDGGAQDTPHRHLVTSAIADHFVTITPTLDRHVEFLRRLSRRTDACVKIFSLNYDPLVERAAEEARVRLIDGFIGVEQAFFEPAVLSETPMQIRVTRGRPVWRPVGTPIHLHKLHGSLGWYECVTRGVRRCGFDQAMPPSATRLMVPPQRRKGSEIVRHPYSPLWTAFRAAMVHDVKPINRLACLGYGFADEHVNDVVDAATKRSDFTLLIFTKELSDTAWNRWSVKSNTVIVTETRCSLKGEAGPGQADLWNFEQLCQEV